MEIGNPIEILAYHQSYDMADKEIINKADLENPLQITKKYLKTNRKIWTKTCSNHSFLTFPSSTFPCIPIFYKETVLPIFRLAFSGLARIHGR